MPWRSNVAKAFVSHPMRSRIYPTSACCPFRKALPVLRAIRICMRCNMTKVCEFEQRPGILHAENCQNYPLLSTLAWDCLGPLHSPLHSNYRDFLHGSDVLRHIHQSLTAHGHCCHTFIL